MIKEFVPYDKALKLKTLGFDEPCFSFYMGGFKELGKIKYVNPINVAETNVLAPTFSQAFRWFREKYGLYHQIHKGYGWEGIIRNMKTENIEWHDGTYSSYEEAELACLDKLIEIVKLNQNKDERRN